MERTKIAGERDDTHREGCRCVEENAEKRIWKDGDTGRGEIGKRRQTVFMIRSKSNKRTGRLKGRREMNRVCKKQREHILYLVGMALQEKLGKEIGSGQNTMWKRKVWFGVQELADVMGTRSIEEIRKLFYRKERTD